MNKEIKEIALANKWNVIWTYILEIFTLGYLFNLIITLISKIIKLPTTSNYILDTVLVCVFHLLFVAVASYLNCSISAKYILKKKNILKSYVSSIIKNVSIYILIAGILYAIVTTANTQKAYQNAIYTNSEYIKKELIIYSTNDKSLIDSYEFQKNKSMENTQKILGTCIFSTKILEALFYLISIKLTEKKFIEASYDDNLFEKDTTITKYA